MPSSHAVACPQCHASLRSKKPLTDGRTVRCPQCGTYFVTPGDKTLVGPGSSAHTPLPSEPLPGGTRKDSKIDRQPDDATEILSIRPPSGPDGTETSAPLLEGTETMAPLAAAGPFPNGTAMSESVRAAPAPAARRDPPTRSWGPVLAAVVIVVAGGLSVGAILRNRDGGVAPANAATDEDRARLEDMKLELQQGLKKLAEDRTQLDQERRRLEFERLVGRAEAASARKDYDEAQTAYRQALKLFPEDARALEGLADVKATLMATQKTAERDREAKQKRQTELQRLLAQAKEAMAKKQYAQAVRGLEEARQLAPDDEAIKKALDEAKAALEKDTAEQKRLSEYKTHIESAQTALEAQRFTDAVREAVAAQQAIPNDGDAILIQKAAENRLAALQDHDKKVSAHKDLSQRAAAAMTAKRYADAVSLYLSAKRLFPDDKNTLHGLRAARLALAKGRQEYGQLMEQADAALAVNRLGEAHRLYKQAAEVLPGDPAAVRGMEATAGVLGDIAATRAAYSRSMTQGIDALRAQRFLAAARAFRDALRMMPGDPDAVQGLRDAEAGLVRGGGLQGDFVRAMQAGEAFLAQRPPQFADAIKSFTEALKILPENPDAQAALHKAKYAQAMSNGQQALRDRNIQEAIDAFEQALKEVPGDVNATAALRQARALKK
jgi:tetratricopeptide (TPR) repeat protein